MLRHVTNALLAVGYFAAASNCEGASRSYPVDHAPGYFIHVGNEQLWVESHGSGPVLLVLSGGPASSHVSMHPAFDALVDTHTIVYYDYRGRGRSTSSEEFTDVSFSRDVSDLDAVRQSLGVERFSIYGFSYGGLVAQSYALEYPDRVERLVLANTLHSPEMWAKNHANINREIENQYPEVWSRIEGLRSMDRDSFDPEMRKHFGVHSRIIRWYNPDRSVRLRKEPGSFNPELFRYFAGNDIEFEIGGQVLGIPDFRPRLREISAPTLILAGRFDRALFPKLQWEFHTHFPAACFVFLENSGSFGHVEEPEVVVPMVRQFLSLSPVTSWMQMLRDSGVPCAE